MGTFVPSGKDIPRKWFVVDASGQTLGRLATKAADLLSGKLNPQYVPYIDMGDHVIVINAEKVRLTGLKSQNKLYRRYTGFPGGLREESFVRLLNRKPEQILEQAIKGMLPKSKLGRAMGTKLKVYRGEQHPHQAQQPVAMEIKQQQGQIRLRTHDGPAAPAERAENGRSGSVLRDGTAQVGDRPRVSSSRHGRMES